MNYKMTFRFKDKQVCSLDIESLSEVPLIGDCMILNCEKEFANFYGFKEKTCTVESRIIDYRDNSVTVVVD